MRRILELAIAVVTLAPIARAQQPLPPIPADSLRLALVPDPQIRIGVLPNGLLYYIRRNAKPEHRAELRLVLNAGSILEDPDQLGLAHMLEHMAFNGTANFPGQAIPNFLETIGMRFGADINAYTSFDETVYEITVPTDTLRTFDRAFQILEDWAHAQTMQVAEVNKERGVVTEEWRLGRGAGQRIFDKQLPVLLQGSRYVERLPIGTRESLAGFKLDALRRFYADWYRPDLMAVVAVGDFDVAHVEQQIRAHFGALRNPRNERARARFDIPDVDTTTYSIVSDKEAMATQVFVYYKHPEIVDTTIGGYRDLLLRQLYNSMLNQRLFELTQRSDPPFLSAGSSYENFLGPKDVYFLGATVKDNGVERGLEALLTEASRVRRFGFTQSELDRERADLLRALERAYAEREKTESSRYASEYVSNFLTHEAIPGIATEFALAKRMLPGITLAELNGLATKWISDRNRVITVSAPDKPGVTLPTVAQLSAVFARVNGQSLTAYADAAPVASLVPNPPRPGTITATTTVPEVGVTIWTLSNGVRVLMRPTDFKADQVLLAGYSPGGTSLIPDTAYAALRSVNPMVLVGGVGGLSLVDLQKALAGKSAFVQPSIGEYSENFSAQASPKDLETMFQLVYLYATAPRADTAAVAAFKARQRSSLANRTASPDVLFGDTLSILLTNNHPRGRPITAASVDSMSLERSIAFFRERFADFSDFTFYIVGNFNVDSIRPMVTQYLGGLPATNRHETFRDLGIAPMRGVVKRVVRKGTEPKARTQLVFSGPFTWERTQRYAFSSMQEVLRLRLRDVLREALGGTYSVTVNGGPTRIPSPRYTLGISYGSAPERVEPLLAAVMAQIDSLKRTGPTEAELAKVRETQRREEEEGMTQNGFWLNTLAFYDREHMDLRLMLRGEELRSQLTRELVREAAKKYLDTTNYIQVQLMPEKP